MTYFNKQLDRLIDWHINALTSDDIVVYDKAKDRPVLISALSTKTDVLLTLDRADFHDRLAVSFTESPSALRASGFWSSARRAQYRLLGPALD